MQEIIITAGGENVAPVLIEDAIKLELPIASQAMVVGDRRKFLSILITLRVRYLSNFYAYHVKIIIIQFWVDRSGRGHAETAAYVDPTNTRLVRKGWSLVGRNGDGRHLCGRTMHGRTQSDGGRDWERC